MKTKLLMPMVLVAAMAGTALAQPNKGAPGKPGKPGKVAPGKPGKPQPSPEMLQKVRERVRMMRMWKMTELLDLDEATAAKLFPLLKSYDDKAEPLHVTAQQTRQALRQAAQNKSDDKTVAALIEKMLATQKQLQALHAERIDALRKLLTPAQQAKLIVAMPKIDRMLEQAVRKAIRKSMKKGAARGAGAGAGAPGGLDDLE